MQSPPPAADRPPWARSAVRADALPARPRRVARPRHSLSVSLRWSAADYNPENLRTGLPSGTSSRPKCRDSWRRSAWFGSRWRTGLS